MKGRPSAGLGANSGATNMDGNRIAAIVLIAAGILGLVYGGFNYTSETHQADVGSLHLSVDETKHVNVPVWAGIGAIVIGGLLLGAGRRRG
jgi:TRAP-type C4-dicarboxylate transport system permease small subunit